MAPGCTVFAEGVSVVGGDEDDGFLKEPKFLERVEDPSDMVVDIVDTAIVQGAEQGLLLFVEDAPELPHRLPAVKLGRGANLADPTIVRRCEIMREMGVETVDIEEIGPVARVLYPWQYLFVQSLEIHIRLSRNVSGEQRVIFVKGVGDSRAGGHHAVCIETDRLVPIRG